MTLKYPEKVLARMIRIKYKEEIFLLGYVSIFHFPQIFAGLIYPGNRNRSSYYTHLYFGFV